MSKQIKKVSEERQNPNPSNLDRPSRPRCLSALPANIKEILDAISKSKAQGPKA